MNDFSCAKSVDSYMTLIILVFLFGCWKWTIFQRKTTIFDAQKVLILIWLWWFYCSFLGAGNERFFNENQRFLMFKKCWFLYDFDHFSVHQKSLDFHEKSSKIMKNHRIFMKNHRILLRFLMLKKCWFLYIFDDFIGPAGLVSPAGSRGWLSRAGPCI